MRKAADFAPSASMPQQPAYARQAEALSAPAVFTVAKSQSANMVQWAGAGSNRAVLPWVGLTQEAQQAASRRLLNLRGRSVRTRSVLEKSINNAARTQVLGFLRQPHGHEAVRHSE